MKFMLLDRVESLEPGKRIVGTKTLSLAEEYLQDHFPSFPALPGVLMIEAMIQAAAWLERLTTDFAHSLVVLDEARNVKYGAFFRPGTTMRVEVELLKHDEAAGLWTFKGSGAVGDQATVGGRLILRASNLADDDPSQAETDRRLVEAMRERWQLIQPRRAAAAS